MFQSLKRLLPGWVKRYVTAVVDATETAITAAYTAAIAVAVAALTVSYTAADEAAFAARIFFSGNDVILSAATATLVAGDGKISEFISVAGANPVVATILGATTPLKAMVNGTLVTISDDTKTVNFSDGKNVIYLKSDGTVNVTSSFPIIDRVQPAAPSAGDHWYDTSGPGIMYKYSGAAWVATPEIPIGYGYVNAGTHAIYTGCYGSCPACVTMQAREHICGHVNAASIDQNTGTYTISAETVVPAAWFTGGATCTHATEPLTANPVLRAQWGIIFDATSTWDVSSKGGRKASGATGTPATPAVTGGALVGTGGGGGGSSTAAGGNSAARMSGVTATASSTAVGGGVNTNGAAAVAPVVTASAKFRGMLRPGEGYGIGGGAGAGDGTAGPDSGPGGGRIYGVASFIHTCSGTVFNTSGGAGSAPGAGNRGGGAGGSAGAAYGYAAQHTDRGMTVNSAGGLGASGTGTGGAGQNGSAGPFGASAMRKEWW